MGKLKNALTEVSLAVVDSSINAIPDPTLRMQIRALTFAVKIPYVFLKELLPTETDEFVKDVLSSDKITKRMINSSEFQQALGNTLQNIVYTREKEKREIIKKVFSEAYISQDEYAKNNLERLQNTANNISIQALQHLAFVKRDIIPLRDRNFELDPHKNPPPVGFTPEENKEFKKLTTPISKYYDEWHLKQAETAREAFNTSPTDTNRRDFDLQGAKEQKLRRGFGEFWSELDSLGIFRQGNDPTIGLVGGGGGTVQYITEFGEEFLRFIQSLATLEG